MAEAARRRGPGRAIGAEAMIHAVVLAAGRSARMAPEHKLLRLLAGRPVIRRTVEALLAAELGAVTLVVGHRGAEVERAARSGLPSERVQVVAAPGETGMAASLLAGLESVPEPAAGVMVALGDMPLVRTETIRALVGRFELGPDPAQTARRIVVPVWRGQRGHPVLWGRGHFEALREVSGDAGGRDILLARAADVIELETADAGVTIDLDTEAAFVEAAIRVAAQDTS